MVPSGVTSKGIFAAVSASPTSRASDRIQVGIEHAPARLHDQRSKEAGREQHRRSYYEQRRSGSLGKHHDALPGTRYRGEEGERLSRVGGGVHAIVFLKN